MGNAQSIADETVRRGESIYTATLRNELETEHAGKYVAIDVDTCNFEIAEDMLTAIDRAKARHPEGSIYVARIGHATAVKLGSGTCRGER